jgi:hypothetical protein
MGWAIGICGLDIWPDWPNHMAGSACGAVSAEANLERRSSYGSPMACIGERKSKIGIGRASEKG